MARPSTGRPARRAACVRACALTWRRSWPAGAAIRTPDEEEDTMDGRLDGQVALVTGGTRGAGRGMAAELGAAGATGYGTGPSTPVAGPPPNRAGTAPD